jgi:Transposase DDE domain
MLRPFKVKEETFSEKISWLVKELFGKEEPDHEQLTELMFSLISQFCQKLPSLSGPGRRPTYSNETILKIDLLMHLTGKRGETEILRHIKRHYKNHFDKLPGQSRLWHRLRQAIPLIERFRHYLLQLLNVNLEDIRILDTCPIPVALSNSRPHQGNGFDLADGGYCASKKLSFFGFKLGLVMTPQGIPDHFELFPARPHDVTLLRELLDPFAQIMALGHKGFIDDDEALWLEDDQQVTLITYRRSNQHQQNSALQQWLLGQHRHLIETVFAMLVDHLHLQHTGAKTDLGLFKRIAGIMTAFTLAIYLNFLLGRPLLNIKPLFA